MKTTFITVLFLLAALSPINKVYAQDGSLDASFDLDGIATTTILSSVNNVNAMAVQSDGKIVLVGYTNGGSYDYFALVRLNTNGSLDNTFDGDGKVISPVGSWGDRATAVAIQSDGKIVVAGASSTGSSGVIALARYNTDGSFDASFGVVNTVIGGQNDIAYAMALQSDGKIVVAGSSYNTSTSINEMVVTRYKTNGVIDSTFDADGIVITPIGTQGSSASAVVIQSDGKIAVTGSANSSGYNDVAIVRYNSNGSLDNTFDSDGIAITSFGSSASGSSLALQSDGKFVVAGYNNNTIILLRYSTTGSLDNTFDTDGIVTTPNGNARAVAIQSDGKIVIAGATTSGTVSGFSSVRYTTNGSIDNTYDTDGFVLTSIGANNDVVSAMCLQSDGKILVAGNSNLNLESNMAVVRYNNGTATGIKETNKELHTVSVYPNPFHSSTTIQFNTTVTDVDVTLYNIYGQTVKTIHHISGSFMTLPADDLPSGLYYMRTTQGQKEISTEKLVITD
jgi:uncharacterized delta-60 repeat protein